MEPGRAGGTEEEEHDRVVENAGRDPSLSQPRPFLPTPHRWTSPGVWRVSRRPRLSHDTDTELSLETESDSSTRSMVERDLTGPGTNPNMDLTQFGQWTAKYQAQSLQELAQQQQAILATWAHEQQAAQATLVRDLQATLAANPPQRWCWGPRRPHPREGLSPTAKGRPPPAGPRWRALPLGGPGCPSGWVPAPHKWAAPGELEPGPCFKFGKRGDFRHDCPLMEFNVEGEWEYSMQAAEEARHPRIWTLLVHFTGRTYTALLESGSSISMVRSSLLPSLPVLRLAPMACFHERVERCPVVSVTGGGRRLGGSPPILDTPGTGCPWVCGGSAGSPRTGADGGREGDGSRCGAPPLGWPQ